MATIIAMANQRGGVAKTTTCLNLGHALAERDRRVLLVDLDTQASLTISLGLDVRELKANVYDVLLQTQPGLTLSEVIQATKMKRVDVAAASIDLSKAEFELVTEMNRERVLTDALKPLERTYDFILIDCPPSLGLLTTNALTAAGHVLIPLQSDYLAMRGAELLLSTIEKVRSRLNPELELLGVLATMHDQRTQHSRDVLKEVQAAFGDRTFRSIVPYSVRAKESVVAGKSILQYDGRSKLAKSYRALADEILAYASLRRNCTGGNAVPSRRPTPLCTSGHAWGSACSLIVGQLLPHRPGRRPGNIESRGALNPSSIGPSDRIVFDLVVIRPVTRYPTSGCRRSGS